MIAVSPHVAEPRREAKLLLPATKLDHVTMWLRVHEAQFAPVYEPRWVNNIYFDTEACAALKEAVEGDCRRMKVRLRWYGDLEWFKCSMLEFKCKIGPLGWKRSCAIEAAFDLLAQSWNSIVRAIRNGAPVDRRVFFDQACRPALINRYHRAYYLSFDGSVRITVDSHMCSWGQSMGLRPNLRRPTRFDEYVVLEFKASHDRTKVLSDAIHALGCRINKHSKYVTGMTGMVYVLY